MLACERAGSFCRAHKSLAGDIVCLCSPLAGHFPRLISHTIGALETKPSWALVSAPYRAGRAAGNLGYTSDTMPCNPSLKDDILHL